MTRPNDEFHVVTVSSNLERERESFELMTNIRNVTIDSLRLPDITTEKPATYTIEQLRKALSKIIDVKNYSEIYLPFGISHMLHQFVARLKIEGARRYLEFPYCFNDTGRLKVKVWMYQEHDVKVFPKNIIAQKVEIFKRVYKSQWFILHDKNKLFQRNQLEGWVR